MSKKYKVSFWVEGDDICDDVPLTKANLEETILTSLDKESSIGVRGGPYAKITKIEIQERR